MALAAVLIVVGVVTRVFGALLAQTSTIGWGLVPLAAISLYAGARLPRRWAWVVPAATVLLSDLYIDWFVFPQYSSRLFGPVRLTSYATYAVIALLGSLRRGQAGPLVRGGMSVGASTLFFLVSNFAVWATNHGTAYPATAAGLLACYISALPFYRGNLIADLFGTATLFGVDALVHRARLGAKAPAATAVAPELS